MKIDELDQLVDEIKRYAKKIKDIQSKADQLSGEKGQLLKHKEELIVKIEQDFGVSLADLEDMIQQWTLELEAGVAEIKRILE